MMFLIRTTLVLITLSSAAGKEARRLSVERIFQKPMLAGITVSNIVWSPDGKHITYLRADANHDRKDLWWFDVHARQSSSLLKASDILKGEQSFSKEDQMVRERKGKSDHGITDYFWSPDGRSIYVPLNGEVFVLDISSMIVRQLTRTSLAAFDPKISPIGGDLSFVREGEVYALDLKTQKQTRLTTGATSKVKNGISEFIAQEEMDRSTGYWWSPDGKHIAYLQIDNTPVKEFRIPNYLADYTDIEVQEYPKAGEANTIVKVGVVPVSGGETIWMSLGPTVDQYVPRVDWSPDGKHLAIQVQTRSQDTLDLRLFDIATGNSILLLRETDPRWVSLHDNLSFLPNRRQFIWSSERDGFQHLYLYDLHGKIVNKITNGEWDVEKLVGVDERNEILYFTATEKSPIERHLYSVNMDGTGLRRRTKVLGWHEITMSPGCEGYVDVHSTLTQPPVVALTMMSPDTSSVIEANPTSELESYDLPKPEHLAIKSSNGIPLNCFVVKPSSMDSGRKYPVIMYVYGGPTSQIVAEKWGTWGGGGGRSLWLRSLVEQGYILVGVDGRGTPGRGRTFQTPIYKRLGKAEIEDQMACVQYLKSLRFVDSSRIMILGKSYGGFLACMAMLTTGRAFKLGIALAPVTDWRDYDTHYTERYLEQPSENPDGYTLSSPVTYARGLVNRLLIVHGIVDDNVHFQESVVLAEELQKANKQFDFMPYPKSTHSLNGDTVSIHLYNFLTRYIQEHL